MATGILARKLGMTQLYNEAGQSVPVSVLSAGPCVVSQVKTADTDGYSALQLAFEPIRESLLGKAALTHLKKKEVGAHRVLG
jgi:large subunit ribosomal protein L3